MITPGLEDVPVWFITGSSQGLGRALLDVVLASGLRAVATLRNPDVLSEYTQKYSQEKLLVTQLDVSEPARISEVFKEVHERFGRIDVVVNNAGYSIEGEIEVTPESEARKLFEVDFWGTVNISKEAVRFMRDINPPGMGGRILNMSSIAGFSATPVFGFYCAAKFAVEGFTESLNKEMLPEWNIKAIIIEPGAFQTAWAASRVNLPIHPKYAPPTTPSSVFRKILHSGEIGDPLKAAEAMLRIASEPDPPLRLQLGSDCMFLVREKAMKTVRDNEKWQELGHSTNFDWFAKESVLDRYNDINN